jgi:rhodanese-related sulfurtransferase
MMRKFVILCIALALVVPAAMAADYNFVETQEFKSWLENDRDMVIVDIQVPEEFTKSHFPGAMETNAYPVKSDEERIRLDQTLTEINATTAAVVIVCPRGGGGAQRTYDYLKQQGVAEERLFILAKGMEGWPHPEMCVTGR